MPTKRKAPAKRKTPARKPTPKMTGTGLARKAAEAAKKRNKRLKDI